MCAFSYVCLIQSIISRTWKQIAGRPKLGLNLYYTQIISKAFYEDLSNILCAGKKTHTKKIEYITVYGGIFLWENFNMFRHDEININFSHSQKHLPTEYVIICIYIVLQLIGKWFKATEN